MFYSVVNSRPRVPTRSSVDTAGAARSDGLWKSGNPMSGREATRAHAPAPRSCARIPLCTQAASLFPLHRRESSPIDTGLSTRPAVVSDRTGNEVVHN